MRALFKNSLEAGDLALREAPDPVPGLGEVVVRVQAAGICGTDLKIYHGRYTRYRPPVIMGHEFAGMVVEVGPGVEGCPPGSLVTASNTVATCGRCRYCLIGRECLCEHRTRLGFNVAGVFADFVKVPADKVHPLPEGVSVSMGALVEPLAGVTHAVGHAGVRAAEVVFIVGPGPMGLLALLLCKAEGAFVAIVGLPVDRPRLALAERLGADLAIEGGEREAAAALQKATGEAEADVVLECSGTEGGISTGLGLCRAMGKYVQIGTWSQSQTVEFMGIAYKELKVSGSFGHTPLDWRDALRLMHTGRVDPTPLVGATLPLEEWPEAFRLLEQRGGPKVLLTPGG